MCYQIFFKSSQAFYDFEISKIILKCFLIVKIQNFNYIRYMHIDINIRTFNIIKLS